MIVKPLLAVASAAALISARPPQTEIPAAAAERGVTWDNCREPGPDPAIPKGAPPNSTYWAAKKPIPSRFRQDASGVTIDFSSPNEVNRSCAGGVPVCKRIFYACIRGKRITMPNPCDSPGERYADLLCHELAHLNGWPATHGD